MKKLLACISLAAVVCLSLTGCDDDAKQKAAGALDAAKDAIGNALDNAPTGEQIIDGIDRFGHAVGAGIDDFKNNSTTT